MNIEDIKDKVIFECIAGSIAYNLNTPQSDEDRRGIFILPKSEYIKISEPVEQVHNEKQDIIFYDLKRFLSLIRSSNPNLIELLWIDPKNIIASTPKMDLLRKSRDIFISKKCYYTFGSYAKTQISKSKGQNKLVHNPQPKEKPSVFDYCRFISFDDYLDFYRSYKRKEPKMMPSRPMPIAESGVKLEVCHAAKLEHVPYVYRLYCYGDQSKGVFRGNENDGYNIVLENIPIEDEWKRFVGLLVFNEDEYKQGVKKWHEYHDWIKNRNEVRWISQEKGELEYDQKNMLHCFRLILSCKNILINGEPIVRFEGENRDFLMKIRNGEFKYEYLISLADEYNKELDQLFNASKLPDSIDKEKIDQLFLEVLEL